MVGDEAVASRLSPLITSHMIKEILSDISFIAKRKLFVTTVFINLLKGHLVPFENQWKQAMVA